MRGLFVNFWGAHLSVLSSSSSMAGEAAVPAWPELAGDADQRRGGRRTRALPARPLGRSSPTHGRATGAGEGTAREGAGARWGCRPAQGRPPRPLGRSSPAGAGNGGGRATRAGVSGEGAAGARHAGGKAAGAAPVGGPVAVRRSEQGRSSAHRLSGGAAPIGGRLHDWEEEGKNK
jgi:hypothetical protein